MKTLIIGGGDPELGLSIARMLSRTDFEIMRLDEPTMLEFKAPIPLPPLFGEEKKKTKPCTSHEYVVHLRDSDNYREWQCRHCTHPLK